MSHPSAPARPVLILVIGVSGCGKTTLARYLANHFGFVFLEGDDFHSAENLAHMASGRPLTDAMREPWIASICDHLREQRSRGERCILAYSGLRRAQRQRFRELGFPTLFLHLNGSREIIRQRLESRTSHFMPPGLLDSQYEALEATQDEPDIISVDVGQTVLQIQQQVHSLVENFLARA